MVRTGICCLIVTLAFLTAGCRSQPVMVSEDGLHLTGTVSVPKRARVKVPKGRISLEEAVELALANSPQIRSADIGVKMGRAGVLGAMSGYLPKVQIQSTYHHVDALAKSDLGIPGVPPISFGSRDSTNVTAMMIVPIYTFGKSEAAYRQALRGAEAAEFDAVRARQNVVAAASQAYVRVLEAQGFHVVAQKSVEQITAHLAVAQQFFEQGMVTKNEVLAAKVRLLQMEHELLRAEGNVKIATANLNRVTGLPVSNPTELADHFSPVETDLTEEECLESAILYRPELGSMDRKRKAGLASISAAKAARYPSINFSGGWNWTSDKTRDNKDNWSVDLMAEWTLFAGFGITAGVRQARYALEQLNEGLRELVDGITLEVKTAYLNLLQSGKGIDVAGEAVKQALENLRIYRERYSQGLEASTDVLDAESQLALARANLARALFENNTAAVNLENAMGRSIEDVRDMRHESEPAPAPEEPGDEGEPRKEGE